MCNVCIGALLRAIARRLLHMAIFRYVDDYFGPDHDDSIEHTMNVFARCTEVLFAHQLASALIVGLAGWYEHASARAPCLPRS